MVRVDKQKNKAKVVKEVLKDPLQSQREIADSADIGLGTVNRNLKELEQTGTKDTRILGICDQDIQIVADSNKIAGMFMKNIIKSVEEAEEKGETVSLAREDVEQIRKQSETSTKRYTIFKGDVTDESGGLKDFDSSRVMDGFN